MRPACGIPLASAVLFQTVGSFFKSRVDVLFVCMGNSCRSVMAEAIARHLAADVIEASSAGLAPLGFVADLTKQVLAENGYSAEGLRSKGITPDVWDAAEIIINISGRRRELTFGDFGKVEDWDIRDPYGESPQVYQRIFEVIEGRVAELAKRLRENA